MADVRELLGRLNPTNIKFDIGSGGGTPELTPQDIAAALAFVPAGLGREVFARLWWPDGSSLSPFELDRVISNLIHAEASRRRRKLGDLQTELHMLEEVELLRRASTDEARQQIARLRGRIEDRKRRVWPHNPGVHVAIRHAVLEEIARPNLCPTCGGRGEVPLTASRTSAVVCKVCKGARILPTSDRMRAERIARDESSFRASWKGLYEWLFAQVLDAEQMAAQQLSRALGRYAISDAA